MSEDNIDIEIEIELIVDQVKNGDKEAFRLLVYKYQRKIHLYCYHMLGNRQEAEDAVQEIFLKCYQKISKYASSTAFSGWLYKLAYYHCINLLKKRKVRYKILNLYRVQCEQSQGMLDYSPSIHELLSLLSPEDRNLLVLRVSEEKSFEEISRIMNRTPAALRKRFERIRKKLKLIQMEEYPKWNKNSI
ncbi:RNA polymerase sigma-70 factor, ECF subfamily [Paenibacillus sp. PDC88]|nr:RNA polymerase sigma-70 factor, ECF subfamily [Paenibacillus sp. PDC88]